MSTGPRTTEGKAASSQNSTRHGLTAKAVVIKGENANDYEQFHAEMLAYYEPDGPKEAYFANEVIENAWRLRRAHRIEAQTFDRNLKDGASLGDAFQDNAKEFDRVRRYITSIERAFYRALRELEELQAARWEGERQQELLETLKLNRSDRKRRPPPNSSFRKTRKAP